MNSTSFYPRIGGGGHTLDPVITRLGELNILDLQCDNSVHSDHSAVIFWIPAPKADISRKRVQIRKWRNINVQSFMHAAYMFIGFGSRS